MSKRNLLIKQIRNRINDLFYIIPVEQREKLEPIDDILTDLLEDE